MLYVPVSKFDSDRDAGPERSFCPPCSFLTIIVRPAPLPWSNVMAQKNRVAEYLLDISATRLSL